MKNHVRLARKLRRDQTPSEKIMWELLRSKRFMGIKFLRQHPIAVIVGQMKRYFIADFYSSEYKIVVEIDGKIHDDQEEYDEYRTELLSYKGMNVLRFRDFEVHNHLEKVKVKLKKQLDVSLLKKRKGAR
jgi:very-short-patch-repair endonuclease